MQTTGIKIEPEIKARLEALGILRDRSPHWLMKTAIMEYLEREEAREEENRLCEERWNRYLQTGEYVTMDEMDAWFEQAIKESRRKAGE